jgi:hypothetical protein
VSDCEESAVFRKSQRVSRRSSTSKVTGSGIVLAVLAVTTYKVLLDVSYALVIPGAHYYALFPSGLHPVELFESYLLLFPVLLVLPRTRDRLSTPFMWMMILISYVPMLTIYGLRAESRAFLYAVAGFWVLTAVIVRGSPGVRMPEMSSITATRLLVGLYLAMLAVAGVVLVAYPGLSVLRNISRVGFDLSGAYDARAEFVAMGVPLNGYYFHWLALVFNPLFFTICLMRRHWIFAGMIFAAQILIAGFVGMRQYYVVLFFVAFMAWLGSRQRQLPALGAGFALVVLLSFLASFTSTEAYLFFVGRFLLDAAQLSFFYFDFFNRHGAIPFAYLIKFYVKAPYPLQYPYAVSPDLLVSRAYFHQSLSAVGGVVADAFMNLGYAGLAVWAIILALTARAADWCGGRLNPALGVAILAMPALAISDTYLVRIFFTTGLLWGFVLLYLASRSTLLEPRTRADEMRLSVMPPQPAIRAAN